MAIRILETDVLIIGGGGAGTAATISASEAGARTMLAVKGRFGQPGKRGAGATSNPIGDYWTIRTVGPKGSFFNPPDLVYGDMIQAGLGMADPELCQIFIDEVGDALLRLQEMGMRFKSKMLATMEADPKAGGTHGIVAVQKAVIEATKTQVVEQANLVEIVVKQGQVVGALGVDDGGDPFVINAGAVIIATGGVGQLFEHSFNPPGNTGDGYALALRAGAELFNMEFMQQGLATTWPTQLMVMLYQMEEPFRLYNADGKAFVEDYLPAGVSLAEVSKLKAEHWPMSSRDVSVHFDRAIKGEVLAGRASPSRGVFLDLSRGERGFEPEVFAKFMAGHGIDIKRDLLQVTMHHHTSNGGIRIDADAQSRVQGLFAAGEAGGWQGADRLGGTMLGGSQVFGWRAGRAAAKVASSRPEVMLGESDAEVVCQQIARFQEVGGKRRPMDLRKDLQRTMWETLLVDKDAESLGRAQSFLSDERERLEICLQISEPIDLALAFEHRCLIEVAEAIIAAASERKESRGTHYRSDYPERNDTEWMTNLLIGRDGAGLKLRQEWLARSAGWSDKPGDIRIKPWG